MKKFKFIKVFVMVLILYMAGCRSIDVTYNGEYPELFTVAINSLLGVVGYTAGHMLQPELELLEEDDYGRQLFSYFEDRRTSTFSLIIAQKEINGYVYFYPHDNFIAITSQNPWMLTSNDFSEDEINKLKEVNNWNQPMDCSECVRVKVVRQKEDGPISDRILSRAYNHALGEDAQRGFGGNMSNIIFFRTDDYGRSIYLGIGRFLSNRFVVMLFQPDGSFDEVKGIMELQDTQNYQSQLRDFKELNDWNQSPPH